MQRFDSRCGECRSSITVRSTRRSFRRQRPYWDSDVMMQLCLSSCHSNVAWSKRRYHFCTESIILCLEIWGSFVSKWAVSCSGIGRTRIICWRTASLEPIDGFTSIRCLQPFMMFIWNIGRLLLSASRWSKSVVGCAEGSSRLHVI